MPILFKIWFTAVALGSVAALLWGIFTNEPRVAARAFIGGLTLALLSVGLAKIWEAF